MIIQARNIFKSYGDLEVLKGVNLEINQGEIVSIIGESGAGKSTLLQILGTLDLPTDIQKKDTEILISGESFLKMNDTQLSKFRNTNIGFVFQHHQLAAVGRQIIGISHLVLIKFHRSHGLHATGIGEMTVPTHAGHAAY